MMGVEVRGSLVSGVLSSTGLVVVDRSLLWRVLAKDLDGVTSLFVHSSQSNSDFDRREQMKIRRAIVMEDQVGMIHKADDELHSTAGVKHFA